MRAVPSPPLAVDPDVTLTHLGDAERAGRRALYDAARAGADYELAERAHFAAIGAHLTAAGTQLPGTADHLPAAYRVGHSHGVGKVLAVVAPLLDRDRPALRLVHGGAS